MTEVSRPPLDPYKVLQVDPEADPEVIQAAYRRLAQKYHPDVAGGDAAQRMRDINAAWEILGDPERRAELDHARARAPSSGGYASGSPADTSAPMGGSHPAAGTPGTPGAAVGSEPGQASGATSPGSAPGGPERVSSDWTSGRSSAGGGYDPASMRAAEGHGAAGPPPGRPSGSVLNFGRYAGWSLGEIARRDLEYIEWLDRVPIGRAYRDEIDAILRQGGRRVSSSADATERRGLFRRR